MRRYQKVILIFVITIAGIYFLLPPVMNAEKLVLNEEARKKAPHDFIKLNQGITHYQEIGSDTAQAVLHIHGFSVPLFIWDKTFEDLKNAGFHVIRFDLFGRGFSDRPDGLYDKKFYDTQITDLLTALKIETNINIIGVSMGGALGAEYTVNNPAKVNKLTLIEPFHEAKDISVAKFDGVGEFLINVWKAPSMPKYSLGDFYQPKNHKYWRAKFSEQMQFIGFKKAILATKH